jgi:hypothetical protein
MVRRRSFSLHKLVYVLVLVPFVLACTVLSRCVVVAHAGKSPRAVEQNTTISGLDSAVGLMGGFEATMYDDSHVSSD